MTIDSLFNRLQSPHLVAGFQRLFGIELLQSNGKNGTRKVKQNGIKENGYKNHASGDSNDSTFIQNTRAIQYVIHNQMWYLIFSFGAALGYETFYASFFPIWFWNIDSAVGRKIVLLWVIVMYVGQTLKDVIRWPRPQSPPVVSLEPDYVMEYGMPSTHAMVGFVLPFSMVIFTNNRYEYPLWIGVVCATIWCLLVCFSRLYLGMHSLLDVIAGLILASLLMAILLPLVDVIDYWHLRSLYSPLLTFTVILLISIFYPKRESWSPSRGDTSVILGAGAGILLGSWLNYQLGIITGPELEPPFPIMWPGRDVVSLALLRAIIGIILLLASRQVGKLLGLNFLCHLRRLNPNDLKTLKRASVEIPQKLVTYVLVGASITFLSPCVFRLLGIERPTVFTEV